MQARTCASRVMPVVVMLAVCGAVPSATVKGETIILIDLTQVETENPTGPNIAGDTWRWGGGDPRFFDLEFSSGNGSHLDLDGGTAQGNEYFPGFGTLAATNHTYDLLKAAYAGANTWDLAASRDGGTTFALIGSITEYTGSLSHLDNYRYEYPGGGGDQSDPVNGPDGAGVNASLAEPWKAWFWLYRDTNADTVSLNIVLGSARAGLPNDGGSFNAEVTFSGAYTGTAVELVGNEPGEVTGTNPFILRNDWNEGYDDGAVLAGIKPIGPLLQTTVPEPSIVVLLSGLGAIGLVAAWRRRKRAA